MGLAGTLVRRRGQESSKPRGDRGFEYLRVARAGVAHRMIYGAAGLMSLAAGALIVTGAS